MLDLDPRAAPRLDLAADPTDRTAPCLDGLLAAKTDPPKGVVLARQLDGLMRAERMTADLVTRLETVCRRIGLILAPPPNRGAVDQHDPDGGALANTASALDRLTLEIDDLRTLVDAIERL